jgi:hypothetical protein
MAEIETPYLSEIRYRFSPAWTTCTVCPPCALIAAAGIATRHKRIKTVKIRRIMEPPW